MSFLPYLCEPPLHKGVQDNHAYILRIKQLDKLEFVNYIGVPTSTKLPSKS